VITNNIQNGPINVSKNIPGMCPVGILWEHVPRFGYIEGTWQTSEQYAGHIRISFLGIWQEYFGDICGNIVNVIW